MAKPRIFISSTCYDLSEVRNQLYRHLEVLGMEAVASDDPTFGVKPGVHSHHACLDEVDRADYLVLIVGGRYGGIFVGSEKSITNEEYRRAAARRIPILSFVKKDVLTAQRRHAKNPEANFSDYVDDARIFDFIDVVRSAAESNWLFPFEKGSEICQALTTQFAHIVKLYSERTVADKTPGAGKGDSEVRLVAFPGRLTQLPDEFKDDDAQEAWLTDGLRVVHATIESIMSSSASGKDEKIKTLWVLGRYGTAENSKTISMKNNEFKQFAWSTQKGQRVFDQLATFGVNGRYEGQEDFNDQYVEMVHLGFKEEPEAAAAALTLYVNTLVERYGEDSGRAVFQSADMTVFS